METIQVPVIRTLNADYKTIYLNATSQTVTEKFELKRQILNIFDIPLTLKPLYLGNSFSYSYRSNTLKLVFEH